MSLTNSKTLHIVSFDIPYPANYGGIIDVFYKVKALKEIGVNVILHCFQYGGKPQQDELLKWCEIVHYYPRNTFMNPFLGHLPYIIKTRKSKTLLQNLSEDDHPILFEGLHTCFWLNDSGISNKTRVVRNHNIEGDYYHHLARVEQKTWKRQYFQREARLLNAFEPNIKNATAVAAISMADFEVLNARYGNAFYLPVFHQNQQVSVNIAPEPYCLYHGNLSVGENDEAACFLVEKVFSDWNYELIIAGNGPSDRLKSLVASTANVSIQAEVDSVEIDLLIKKAKVNVLPTFQSTGIKLKLLNALYNGGHCVVNHDMVVGTGLEPLCHIANDADQFKNTINELVAGDGSIDIELRRKLLAPFSVRQNALALSTVIWDE